MREWLAVKNERKKLIYDQVAARQNLPYSIAVEKDFWVTLVLQSVFELPSAGIMVFKGGTSLSKGWNLIQRFSEDIDLAVDRKAFGFDGRLGSSKRTKLRKRIRSFVVEEFTPALREKLEILGQDINVEVWPDKDSDADPSTIEIEFPSVTESSPYLRPSVLLEINARSLIEPYEDKNLTPLVSTIFPNLDINYTPSAVPCVLPKRTFLEKVFLLHEEFQKNPEDMRADRLSRHLYDLEAIMDTSHGKEALADKELYMDIINHRQHLTKVSGIDYENHKPGKINLIPPTESIKEWERDYKNMQESMIYGDSLPFDQLLERMKELMDRINRLDF